MSTPIWQPGRLYPPGSLVVPRTTAPQSPQAIVNGDFEDGSTGWSVGGAWAVNTASGAGRPAYSGDGFLTYSGSGQDTKVEDVGHLVKPGQTISLTQYIRIPGSGDGAGGRAILVWYRENGTMISFSGASTYVYRTGGAWRPSTVTASAPAEAHHVRAGVSATINVGGGYVDVDRMTWSYTPPAPLNLQYRAVQPQAGFSDSSEPAWPGVLGQQVIDNEVIWEAVSVSRLVWEAHPVLKSGGAEPSWPTTIGGAVPDNTISWVGIDPIIQDDNCPHSKVVVIAKFKVFAGDKDIVRYSATANPTDWTTEKDAGYLGTGVQQNSANHVAAMSLYRANLLPMNATTLQQWAIDPDPSLMDLLDTIDGIGSIWHLAMAPVGDDLLYLSNQGVRSVGVTGQGNNLRAGDVGMPVDSIIKSLVSELVSRNRAGANEQPLGMYWPSMGEYWLCFNRVAGGEGADERVACPTLDEGDRYAEVMVYTMSQIGQVGAWSRYIFPFPIDAWAQEGDDLYVRDGDNVYRISDEIGACDRYFEDEGIFGEPFNAKIQWPWLDLGSPGVDKQVESFDIVGYGVAGIEMGYDQAEPGYFTERYDVSPDTLRGTPVPMPITAPSLSLRIRYDGWNPDDDTGNRTWGFNAFAINYT